VYRLTTQHADRIDRATAEVGGALEVSGDVAVARSIDGERIAEVIVAAARGDLPETMSVTVLTTDDP